MGFYSIRGLFHGVLLSGLQFPERIYSDAYLPKKGELNRNRQNFDRERIQLFSEERVYDTLIESGLFPQFSNSFLVVVRAE